MRWFVLGLMACGGGDTVESPPVCGVEVCNGVDDDCDGLIDEADPELSGLRLEAYEDLDGDGVGGRPVLVCAIHPGVSAVGGDCDDSDPAVRPGAVEVCNGVDDDCDGLDDAQDPDLLGYTYVDADVDGFGDPASAVLGCAEEGRVARGEDCDDTEPSVYPGAPLVCDGLPDNNCDGLVDAGEEDLDQDGDPSCADCDDADPARSHTLEERCDGIDTDCDGLVDDADPSANPYSCGYCPTEDLAFSTTVPYRKFSYNPCLLDPESTYKCLPTDTHEVGERLHRVVYRTDQGVWRDPLMLFYPPGPGRYNSRLQEWMAFAGYRTLSLGYANEEDVRMVCRTLGDACFFDWRFETLYGIDTSPYIDVSRANSMERRLEVVLAKLVEDEPTMGWERYLLPDGQVNWSRVVLSGWSVGSGYAAFTAHYEKVAGVMLLSGPKDAIFEPTPVPSSWTAAPSLTPSCAYSGAYHLLDSLVAPPDDVLGMAWRNMGMDMPGFNVDEDPGSYTDSAVLSFSVLHKEGCSAHSAMAHDNCLPPEYFEPYQYLFCRLGSLGTCQD